MGADDGDLAARAISMLTPIRVRLMPIKNPRACSGANLLRSPRMKLVKQDVVRMFVDVYSGTTYPTYQMRTLPGRLSSSGTQSDS